LVIIGSFSFFDCDGIAGLAFTIILVAYR